MSDEATQPVDEAHDKVATERTSEEDTELRPATHGAAADGPAAGRSPATDGPAAGSRADGPAADGDDHEDGRRDAADDRHAGDDQLGRKPHHDEQEAEHLPEDDERARKALRFVQDVLEEMDMDCRARLQRPSNEDWSDEVHIEVIGRDSGRVIGKKGQVLAALQFLTHRVINRPGLERRHVLVDAEGYRTRRDSQLSTMARRLGKQAVDQGKIITFEPMNPRDRRVVHLALAKFEGVITKSDGEGDDRRVQIIPVRR